MSGLFGAAASAPSNTQGNISKDVELASPPEDSVSDLAWAPHKDGVSAQENYSLLAAASWDKKVRIWQVNEQGQGSAQAMIEFDGPALGCAWSHVRLRRLHAWSVIC